MSIQFVGARGTQRPTPSARMLVARSQDSPGPEAHHSMTTRGKEIFQPVAAVAAFLFPGAGYMVLGQRARGLWVCVGVMGLILAGTLIGGIDVIDSHRDSPTDGDPWWFIPQACAGPVVFAIDWAHQNPLKHTITPSIGHVNEVGILYVVMAGMLNLIAVVDCSWHAPATRVRVGPAGGTA